MYRRLQQRNRRRGFGDDWSNSDPAGDWPAAGQELPRGSRVRWSGNVTGSAACFGVAPCRQSDLQQLLQGSGFNVEDLSWTYESLWSNTYRINITVVTPIAFAKPEDVFSVLKGSVWNVYEEEPVNIVSNVLNIPVRDQRTGNQYYSVAPVVSAPPDTRANNPGNPSRCDDKSGLEWANCKLGLDSLASNFGLAAGYMLGWIEDHS